MFPADYMYIPLTLTFIYEMDMFLNMGTAVVKKGNIKETSKLLIHNGNLDIFNRKT